MPCKTSDFRTQKFPTLCALTPSLSLSLSLSLPLSFFLSLCLWRTLYCWACVRVCRHSVTLLGAEGAAGCSGGVGWTSFCLTCATSRWYLGGVSRPGHNNNNNTYRDDEREVQDGWKIQFTIKIEKWKLFISLPSFFVCKKITYWKLFILKNSYGCKKWNIEWSTSDKMDICLTVHLSVYRREKEQQSFYGPKDFEPSL